MTLMSKKSRAEALDAARRGYQCAETRDAKTAILDALTHTTGLNRKYVITAIKQVPVDYGQGASRRRRYGPEARKALTALWEASGCPEPVNDLRHPQGKITG